MIGLTAAIATGGLISAIIFGYQLREMQAAGDLTRESIKISEEALKNSRQTLISAQRPWISIDMTLSGPLTFDQNGAEIKIGLQLKNHGHSPALNVRHFVIFDPTPGGRKGPDFCEQRRARRATFQADNMTDVEPAEIIFPYDTVSHSYTAGADATEIKIATQRRDTISPIITVCVNYASKFDDVQHQTQLNGWLLKVPTVEDQSFAIKLGEGTIPKSDPQLLLIFGSQRAD